MRAASSPSRWPAVGGSGQRAGGAGRVEDLVVRAPEELADADADFVAGDRGGQQVAARSRPAPAPWPARPGTPPWPDGTPSRCARRPARPRARRRRSPSPRSTGCCALRSISTSLRPAAGPSRARSVAMVSTGRAPLPADGGAEPVDQQVFGLARRRLRECRRSAGRRRSGRGILVRSCSDRLRPARSDCDVGHRCGPALAGSPRCARPPRASGPCGSRSCCCAPGGSSAGHGPGRRAAPRASARAPAAADAPTARPCRSCARWRSAPASSRSITCAGCSARAKASRMSALQRRAVLVALRVASKRGSVASAGCSSTLSQNSLPFALVLQAQHHRAAVARRERAVGVDGRVRGARCAAAAARRRRRSTSESPSTRPSDSSIDTSMCEPLPVLPPLQQRGQDAGVGVHAGGDVGDRVARLARLVGRAGDRQEAGLALDQQVVGLLVAVGAVVAVAGDVADDQRADAWPAAPRSPGPCAPRRRAPGSAPARRPARPAPAARPARPAASGRA